VGTPNLILKRGDFNRLAQMVLERTGICLSDHKLYFVQSRLTERIVSLGYQNFADYCRDLEKAENEQEWSFVFKSLTTNLSRFFREAHHFELLEKALLEWSLQNKDYKTDPTTKLRLWSAGCAAGQEAYSMAFVVAKVFGTDPGFDIRILATDINKDVLDQACEGKYETYCLKDIPQEFHHYVREDKNCIRIHEDIAQMVKFGALNLMDPWPMQCRFDVVFCRNVAIYFAPEGQKKLFTKCANLMKDHGLLCVGHSETLLDLKDLFLPLGQTAYVKKPTAFVQEKPDFSSDKTQEQAS
jgi:chemotaxis protein methyltransferase CheR